MKRASWPGLTRLDLGIFLISLAILLLELLLTRVFSVVMFHHFSFLAVSLAMTGLGLGGLIVNLRPGRFRDDNVSDLGPRLALVFAATLIFATWVAFNTPVLLMSTAQNWIRVVIVLLLSLAPLTAGGLIIAHILAFNSARANRLYFFDLLGAGVACLSMVFMVGRFGAPTSLLLTAAIGVVGGAVLATSRERRIHCWGFCSLVLLLSIANLQWNFFDVKYAKGKVSPETLVTRWNSFSRVQVNGRPGDMTTLRRPNALGFSSRLETEVYELDLLYDADALTQIVGFDGDLAAVEYLLWDVTSAPHHARRNSDVLVIGAGGARDVFAALAAGADHVTGVEINDVTVDLMRGPFREFTGGVYVDHPNVTIFTEDGRSFVRRTSGEFDLIQASLVDTWAASSAGAYALAENSLYTVEAFIDYFSRLEPEGMVSFSRWFAFPPIEVLRIVALAKEALSRIGMENPEDHIAIVRTLPEYTRAFSLATIMVKRSPFTAGELESLATWADDLLFDLPYLPPAADRPGTMKVFRTFLGPDEEAAAFVKSRRYDLSPTTDDKPFFFDRVPLAAWLGKRLGLDMPKYAEGRIPLGSRTLLAAFCVTGVGTLVLIFLPFFLRPKDAVKVEVALPLARRITWVSYFACLGLGYIVVEIVLIQRFNLYLGNPSYALTVALFTMLASSGLGALVAGRWSHRGALVPMLSCVCAGIAVVMAGLDPLIDATLGSPASSRILFAVAFVAPIGFVMGMPFPSGLRQAGLDSESLVSWAWAVNGGASVFGSVSAVVVSMTVGFSASLMLALFAYLVALALTTRLGSDPSGSGVGSG